MVVAFGHGSHPSDGSRGNLGKLQNVPGEIPTGGRGAVVAELGTVPKSKRIHKPNALLKSKAAGIARFHAQVEVDDCAALQSETAP